MPHALWLITWLIVHFTLGEWDAYHGTALRAAAFERNARARQAVLN